MSPNKPPVAYPEATASAIIFGILFGAMMNMAITYSGLKMGFTLGGSAIAAVVGYGVLRGILRRGSILENNIAQTIASGVNVPNSGVIFTIPVLFLLGQPLEGARLIVVTLAAVAGAVLGVVFIIPLRKQMIDIERLRFPSAVAVAVILKSPGAGVKKSLVLALGIVVAMLVYLPVALPEIKVDGKPLPGYSALGWRLSDPRPDLLPDPQLGARQPLDRSVDRDGDRQPDLILTNEAVDVGRLIGLPDEFQFVFAIAPFALGAGYLTGRAGLMVLAGGALAFFVLNPLAYAFDWVPGVLHADQVPEFGYRAINRPLGIGLLLGGALIGVVFALPAIKEAVKSLGRSSRGHRGDDELGLKTLLVAVGISLVLLFVASDVAASYQDNASGLLAPLNQHVRSLIIAVVGCAWIWFAGIIIAQCTGMTDWSPISGMALLTVVLVMMLAGPNDVVGAVLVGAALCVATTCASDMMQDLKTGYLVGATPKRQQITELLTTWMGPIISIATLLLIVEANMEKYRTPIGPGTDTTAPQAVALQAVITGIQGGEMPYALYGCGAVLGMLLGLGAFPGLGVLVGLSMYLPIDNILTYGIGCLLNMVVARTKGRTWAEEWGVPFCAGLIVGEAVLAMVINVIVLARST